MTVAARAARYGLVSAWNLADASDSFGANTLTNNNAATFAVGKIGFGVQLTAASSQSLSIADNAPLSTGAVDFMLGGWFKFDSLGAERTMLSKWQTDGNKREWLLYFDNSVTRLKFLVDRTGASSTQANATASTFGAPTTGVFYFVCAYHRNGVGLGISVNGGAFDTTAYTTGLADLGSAFRIGAYFDGAVAGFMDGMADACFFLKSPIGGLTAALAESIRDFMYNGGSGREYPGGWR